MRTRSKPLSPSSYVSLDDIPRRRRATRSASAQPQDQDTRDVQTADSKPASTAPKTRGKKKAPSTRGRKKSVRHSTKPVTADSEQHHGDSAGAASGDPASNGGSTSQSQDTEVYQPTVNSFEQTTSVLPSVEPNEIDGAEISGDADNYVKWAPLGPQRKFPKAKAYDILSPSNSPSSLNRVEKSIKTTPIRRTRLSYAAISRRRRSEASGRIDRTLYRLPELLSQNEADGGVSDSTNLTTRPPPQASTPMTNPGAASLHLTHDDALVTGSPSKPGNAPTEVNASAERSHQAESPSSPGFVKWAFNQVSRRWTNIRDRYAGSTPTTAESPAVHSDSTPATPSRSTLSVVPNTDGPSSKTRALTSAASPANRLTRSVSLYSSGLDPELKAHCYGRQDSRKPSEKRKREVTPPSPVLTSKPKARGFCLDDDFFTYTEEEYAAQELYEAEQRKRQAEEAENAEAGAPSAKKIKVDPPKQPTRRQPAKNRSPTKRSSATLSPSQQPGFRPNARRTYAVPDLETIDSSRLISEADLPRSSPHPHDRPQISGESNTTLPGLSYEPIALGSLHQGPQTNSQGSQAATPQSNPLQVDPAEEERSRLAERFFVEKDKVDAERENTRLENEKSNNTAAEPEDASPLTRARTKAEQFKPKTPSRLREAHRFSSSMTRTSPFSQPDINSPTIDRQGTSLLQQDATSQAPGLQETEHPPAFRTLEEIKEVCDADWLLEQCPSGDLRQLKWPKKISLVDQLHSHGVHLTPEELAEVDESWNDPERRKMEMDAMRTVWATAARKPLGAPVDWSAWNKLPQ